ncbi:hypothetical protein L218DRAFT_849531 [Marasmius fiardii PR-910]|nr:hypothetical protein L218DRAFT_849531 [Marasmius fiardii PR-910]
MPVPSDLSPYVPQLLLNVFKRYSTCYIHRLPLEILVDGVMIHLSIEDVMRMRRVDKAFFLITHEPIIWRRFLERLNIPIPPIRPNFRYSLEATDFEIEQIVTRAIRTDDNWRGPTPQLLSKEIVFAFHQVLELKLLPGGRYLVASIKDVASYRFWICIYDLESPRGLDEALVARRLVPSKAYNIHARFDMKGGYQGITIMFTISRRGLTEYLYRQDPAEWSSETDLHPPYPLAYELVILRTALGDLERLSDPAMDHNSLAFAEMIQSLQEPLQADYIFEADAPIENASLFDENGICCASFSVQDQVIIHNLNNSEVKLQLLRDSSFEHNEQRIRAVRVLPQQRRVLVVRTVVLHQVVGQDSHLIEVYDLPQKDDAKYVKESQKRNIRPQMPRQFEAKDRVYIEGKTVTSFHISDYPTIPRAIDLPELYERRDKAALTPISIYARTKGPHGIIHYEIFPVLDPLTDQWKYALDSVIPQTVHESEPVDTRVIPGITRSLVYTVPGHDRTSHPKLLSLRRYFNPRYAPEAYKPYAVKDQLYVPVLERERFPTPKILYRSFIACDPSYNGITESGVSAITWDEGTGRVCIAALEDMKIVVMDLGRTVVWSDRRFADWQRAVQLLRESQEINWSGATTATGFRSLLNM